METVKPSVNGSKEPKEKALSLAVAQIERQFGKGGIMRLGAQPAALDIAVIPTGCGPQKLYSSGMRHVVT